MKSFGGNIFKIKLIKFCVLFVERDLIEKLLQNQKCHRDNLIFHRNFRLPSGDKHSRTFHLSNNFFLLVE